MTRDAFDTISQKKKNNRVKVNDVFIRFLFIFFWNSSNKDRDRLQTLLKKEKNKRLWVSIRSLMIIPKKMKIPDLFSFHQLGLFLYYLFVEPQ